VPVYIDHSPWETVRYADPPRLLSRTEQLPSETDGADSPVRGRPSLTNETGEAGETDNPHLQTQGSEEHRLDESVVEEQYESRGFEVARPDTETTASVPDLIFLKNDILYLGEVERTGTSRPANILTNAARAVYYDVPVYFFVKDKSAAKTVAKILRDPVHTHTDTGARLYTLSRALTLENGGYPLLPADATVSESKWFLENDTPESSAGDDGSTVNSTATLELRADGRVIASGPVTDSVATYEYETDVVHGESVPDNRTRIHPPFVPTKLAYLSTSTIRYQRNEKEFATYEPDDYQPGWNYTDDEGKETRYKTAFGTFVENKTIPVPGGEILKQEAIPVLKRELYEPQTSRKAPPMNWAARALWKHVDKKSNNREEEAGTVDKVKDRKWRWPRGVVSPDLPFAGDSSEFDLDQWL